MSFHHPYPTFHHAHEVPAELHDAHHDAKRPIFHIGPPKGWASDPCGPIFYKGRYHMFYQHLGESCQWHWGLCWDHVVSDDLVHWRNLPPAVVPSSPDGWDADGCFSGTVELDPELGVPVILYTGVFLKTNAAAVSRNGLPPPAHDPGTIFVETQLAAVPADPDDPDLTYWAKLPKPVIALPPAGFNISCWRDPFCLSRPAAAGGSGEDWVLLLASGIRGVGGAVLRFKSKHLTHGWEFDGLLADGDNMSLGISGQDWECPILAKLPLSSHADEDPSASAADTSNLGPSTPLLKPLPCPPSLSSLCSVSSSCSNLGSNALQGIVLPSSPVANAAAPTAVPTTVLPPEPASGNSSSSVSVSGEEVPVPAPLTEPVLAAVEAGIAAITGDAGHLAMIRDDGSLQKHSAVALDTWLDQAEPPAASAAAATAAALASDNCGTLAMLPGGSCSPSTTARNIAAASSTNATSSNSSSSVMNLGVGKAGHSASCTTLASADDTGGTGKLSALLPAASRDGGKTGRQWWFCISPDACNNPITWWLGDYDGRLFDIAAADGPHRLDLGTTLYAATLWQDTKGRQVLYGWIQEHRRVPTPPALCTEYTYAGCISVPRVLQLLNGRLHQAPLPELDQLRTKVSWHAEDLLLQPGGPLRPLQVVSSVHLDICVTFMPPASAAATSHSNLCLQANVLASPSGSFSASRGGAKACGCADAASSLSCAAGDGDDDGGPRVGLVFKSWLSEGRGAAVLSYNWQTQLLAVDFDEPFPSAYQPHPEDSPAARRVGGKLRYQDPGKPLTLRILIDGSAVEVFTSSGETLTTRMYRGHPASCGCTGCASMYRPGAAIDKCTKAFFATGGSISTCSQQAEQEEDEAGIALFAAGAAALVRSVDVWEMGSCMLRPGAATSSKTAAPAFLAAPGSISRPPAAPASPGAPVVVHQAATAVCHVPAGQQARVAEEFLQELHIQH